MPSNKIDNELTARDSASRVFQSAQQRLTELRAEIDRLRAKGSINLSVGDVRNLSRLTSEAARLEKGLAGIGQAGTAAANQMGGAFSNLGNILGGAGLGNLGAMLGGAGLVTLGTQIGRTLVDLTDLGETLSRQRAYFEVWSGGARAAADNLAAMSRATQGAMSEIDMMAGANKLLSMGLATNAKELETLAHMAVMLGGSTRTASQSMEEFALLLANQSILRLDTFGISGARVRERIEELQSATKGLSREQAFLTAVMEEGGRKVKSLDEAGINAATSADQLRTAWQLLREEVAKGLTGGDTEKTFKGELAKELNNITDAIAGQAGDYEAKLRVLMRQRADIAERLAGYNEEVVGPAVIDQTTAALVKLDAQIASLGIAKAAAETAAWTADLGANSAQVAAATQYYREWAAAITGVSAAMGGIGTLSVGAGGMTDYSYLALWREKVGAGVEATARLREDKEVEVNSVVAGDYSSKMSSAVSRITSMLQRGMSEAKGLWDMGGGEALFEPGANGPFENLYRALDVAKLGAASPWAAALGLTQEDAARISADFQRGLFTPEVLGLVDMDALVNEARMAELAEASQAALAKAIAASAGTSVNLVSNLFGFGGTAGKGGVGARQAQEAMDQIGGALNTAANDEGFSDSLAGTGRTTWIHFQAGFVAAARGSDALKRAIEAIVQSVLGGGYRMAANAAGVVQ